MFINSALYWILFLNFAKSSVSEPVEFQKADYFLCEFNNGHCATIMYGYILEVASICEKNIQITFKTRTAIHGNETIIADAYGEVEAYNNIVKRHTTGVYVPVACSKKDTKQINNYKRAKT
jgi:hypothetical protein